MYSASSQFHAAVKAGKPQKALLIFDDAVFDDGDIDVSVGIEMDEYFNTEEDICIGQALSNEIRFTLFNDESPVDGKRPLNNYAFGQFKALLGVQTGVGTYTQSGNVAMSTGTATFIGRSSPPYLTRNGTDVRCGFPVHTLIDYNGTVYAFNKDGRATAFTEGGAERSVSINAFMRSKGARMAGYGMYYNQGSRQMILNHNGIHEVYTFVPLGTFIAKRPAAPDQIRIDMTCYDLMQLFDGDMNTTFEYPVAIRDMVSIMCRNLGVTCSPSTIAMNGYVDVLDKPDEFDNCSYRDVLKWVAEVCCCNARFNRDGILIFDWLHSTNQRLDRGDYSEFNPYWYTTGKVSRVINRTSDNGIDMGVGAGETYLIQDNPFTHGLNEYAKEQRIREEKQKAYEKRAIKISFCIKKNGMINYEKLNWMSENADKWQEESDAWDAEHPEEEG